MSNTRIVHIVQHLAPGGLEMMTLELARDEPHVHIISLEGSLSEAVAKWPALKALRSRLHFLHKQPGVQIGTLRQLWSLLRSLRPSTVQTHHIGPLLYGGIAARCAGIARIIHTEHDAWHLDDPRRARLENTLLKLVDPILVADAEAVSTQLLKHCPNSRPTLIRNGIDTERFRPLDRHVSRRQLALPATAKLVGCAARLVAVKAHNRLLDAIFRLPPHIHLALAGTGPLEATLRQQAVELGIDTRVHFLGHVEDMPAFYSAIDVFCLASSAEGMPLSVLEAQACNTPVVATNVGGLSEAICPGSGRLVPHEDSRALAHALMDILKANTHYAPRAFIVRHGSAEVMKAAYRALHLDNI